MFSLVSTISGLDRHWSCSLYLRCCQTLTSDWQTLPNLVATQVWSQLHFLLIFLWLLGSREWCWGALATWVCLGLLSDNELIFVGWLTISQKKQKNKILYSPRRASWLVCHKKIGQEEGETLFKSVFHNDLKIGIFSFSSFCTVRVLEMAHSVAMIPTRKICCTLRMLQHLGWLKPLQINPWELIHNN